MSLDKVLCDLEKVNSNAHATIVTDNVGLTASIQKQFPTRNVIYKSPDEMISLGLSNERSDFIIVISQNEVCNRITNLFSYIVIY